MPNRTLKNEQDCQDFISGLKLLGTGGGGSPAAGIEMLRTALAEGLQIGWVDANEIPDDIYSCTAFGSGSISKETPSNLAEIDQLGEKIGLKNKYGYKAVEAAIRELESYINVKIGAIVPVELGAGNAASPLITGARMGIPVIDGDYSGRAVPQDMQTTYFLNDIPTYPAAIVDWWGDVIILKEAASTEMGERIGKLLSVAAYGSVYFASIPLSAKQTRATIVPGTLTLSLDLGQAVRKARQAGKDPIAETVDVLDGWKLFSGVVTSKEWANKDGVMVGTTHIQGKGEFTGHKMDVWFLNENHVAWLDEKPYVFSPDLIILADPETGEGYTNTELKEGDLVAMLGAKTNPAFRSPKAIQFFGPRFWGFDFDYRPIEEVLG